MVAMNRRRAGAKAIGFHQDASYADYLVPAEMIIPPRTVVAGTKLPSLGDTPLYFRVVSVSISPGQKISLSPPNGILYQLSGSTEVSAGEAKTITGGGGVLIAGGTTAALTAGSGEQSTLLYFLLAPKEALDQPVAAALGTVKELYRTTAPLPAAEDLRLLCSELGVGEHPALVQVAEQ